MILPTLYARTNTGAVQTWTIEISEHSYRTIFGQLDGKLQTTEWTTCVVTNFGRSNQRTSVEQAEFEANSLWNKKLESGYHKTIDEIDDVKYIEPMLAKNWDNYKKKVVFPLFCQPKLDGLRAVITKDGAFSRNGKPWVTVPHILAALKPLFDEFPDLVLDGELYNHALHDDFNEIVSLVKKTKPSKKDLKDCAAVVQFWWYDVCDPKSPLTSRQRFMRFNYRKYLENCDSIVLVPTYETNDETELTKLYDEFLDNNYEGQMIRLNSPYEFKRSNSLLKRKEFKDDEYVILDILEGNGSRTGMAGAMCFETASGHPFKANIKGKKSYLRELWVNKHLYIGQKATVRYFNLTPPPACVPRFPYVYGISPDKN